MIRKIININEDLCNGCGLCVNACHEGAIDLVDGKAKLMREHYCDGLGDCLPACPTGAITFEEREAPAYDEAAVKATQAIKKTGTLPCSEPLHTSNLRQWPIQIKLAPINAPYLDNAHLLIAADCTAYAYGHFHNDFMTNKITLIGCPKLDEGDYSEKLTQLLAANNIRSVTIVRMSVPCCSGIENAVKTALQHCGKMIPWNVVIISTEGNILD